MINNLQSTLLSASGRKYCKLVDQKENSGERRKTGKDTKKQNLGRCGYTVDLLEVEVPLYGCSEASPQNIQMSLARGTIWGFLLKRFQMIKA